MTKKLMETIVKTEGQKVWDGIVAKASTNPYFIMVGKNLKKMKGETCLDSGDLTPLGDVYDQILLACEPYLTRKLAMVVTTDKVSEQFNISDIPEFGDMSEDEDGCESFPIDNADAFPVTVLANRIKGLTHCHTREYLEDCVWAVEEWQIMQAGKAAETEIMDFILSQYLVDFGQSITGEHDHLDWDDVIDGYAAATGADSIPDTLITSPADYANLFKDQEFINSLITGSTDPIKSGIVQSTLGMTFIRSSRMPEYMALILDSQKAGALVIRRDVKIESYEDPRCNQYGFVASIRYGFDSLSECAITLISDC